MSTRIRSLASVSRRAIVLLALSAAALGSLLNTPTAGAQIRSALERWVLLVERVQAGDTDQLTVTSSRARAFWVTGDGDTDLDCRLYQNGQLVDLDTDDTDVCLLYTRGRSGTFRLTVRNYGDVYNDYVVEAER
jgi:hypothetical protein